MFRNELIKYGGFLLQTPGCKEKFGKPIIEFEQKLETSDAFANRPIAEELQELPEKKSKLSSVAGTGDNESGDDNQV